MYTNISRDIVIQQCTQHLDARSYLERLLYLYHIKLKSDDSLIRMSTTFYGVVGKWVK